MKDKSVIESILLKHNEDDSCSVEIKEKTGILSQWRPSIDHALLDLFMRGDE